MNKCSEHQKELHDCIDGPQLRVRIYELEASLAEANKQSNHFETQWLMTMDAVTSLESELADMRANTVGAAWHAREYAALEASRDRLIAALRNIRDTDNCTATYLREFAKVALSE